MLHSHGIRQKEDNTLDVIYVDESRMVKFVKAGRQCWQWQQQMALPSKVKIFELFAVLLNRIYNCMLPNFSDASHKLEGDYCGAIIPKAVFTQPENLPRWHRKS